MIGSVVNHNAVRSVQEAKPCCEIAGSGSADSAHECMAMEPRSDVALRAPCLAAVRLDVDHVSDLTRASRFLKMFASRSHNISDNTFGLCDPTGEIILVKAFFLRPLSVLSRFLRLVDERRPNSMHLRNTNVRMSEPD